MTDKNGKTINRPQDFMDHCMDAIRYALVVRKPRMIMPSDVGGVKPLYEGMPG